MKYQKLFLLVILFFLFSCTDGMQISQRINELIEEKKITTIIIENHKAINGQSVYRIDQVIVSNQFIEIQDHYLNLEKVKSMATSKDVLSITF